MHKVIVQFTIPKGLKQGKTPKFLKGWTKSEVPGVLLDESVITFGRGVTMILDENGGLIPGKVWMECIVEPFEPNSEYDSSDEQPTWYASNVIGPAPKPASSKAPKDVVDLLDAFYDNLALPTGTEEQIEDAMIEERDPKTDKRLWSPTKNPDGFKAEFNRRKAKALEGVTDAVDDALIGYFSPTKMAEIKAFVESKVKEKLASMASNPSSDNSNGKGHDAPPADIKPLGKNGDNGASMEAALTVAGVTTAKPKRRGAAAKK